MAVPFTEGDYVKSFGRSYPYARSRAEEMPVAPVAVPPVVRTDIFQVGLGFDNFSVE